MPKKMKIKRYHHIYHASPSFSPLRVIGIIAAAAVLGFIGWSAYLPISGFLNGLGSTLSRPAQTDTVSSAVVSSQAAPVVSVPEAEQAPAAPLRAIYLPLAATRAPALDTQLDLLAAQGINAVMIDLKDASGNVLYRSALPSVTEAGVMVENVLELDAFVQKLAAKKMTVIGRVNAFRDPVAPGKLKDAGVKYIGTDMLWLDNSREAGGKAWLNPYSPIAKSYISDIAAEAVSLGVQEILLDSVSFPTGYAPEFCSFGETKGLTRPEALSAFLRETEQRLTAASGKLSVYIPATGALGTQDSYYGANPLTLGGNITLGVMPSLFGDAFSTEELKLTAPLLTPRDTVSTVLRTLDEELADRRVTAMLQGYTDDRKLAYNKTYTAEDIKAQLAALTEHGVESYIIYSPTGNYPQ